jgi:hypothetical protein
MSRPRCCARRFNELDIENLGKEVESVVHNREREIVDRLAVILAMLVRHVYVRERRPTDKTKIHRGQIMCVVRDSPSPRPRLDDPQVLDRAWTRTLSDYDADGWDLPKTCPWTLPQVLNGVLPRDVLHRQRDEIVRMLDARGFRSAREFGSVARGEDTEGSDLDLLADADGTVSLFDLNGVHNELMKALGIRVDVVLSTSRFPERDRAAILADAKPI